MEAGLAGADAALATAEGTPGAADDIAALERTRAINSGRLNTINTALSRGRLTTKTKARLLAEKAGLIRGLRETDTAIAGHRAPATAAQLATLMGAEASLTPDVRDDYEAAAALVRARARRAGDGPSGRQPAGDRRGHQQLQAGRRLHAGRGNHSRSMRGSRASSSASRHPTRT